MTNEQIDLVLAELEKLIVEDQWRDSPEIIRKEAEIEALIKETAESERKIEAWLKEIAND